MSDANPGRPRPASCRDRLTPAPIRILYLLAGIMVAFDSLADRDIADIYKESQQPFVLPEGHPAPYWQTRIGASKAEFLTWLDEAHFAAATIEMTRFGNKQSPIDVYHVGDSKPRLSFPRNGRSFAANVLRLGDHFLAFNLDGDGKTSLAAFELDAYQRLWRKTLPRGSAFDVAPAQDAVIALTPKRKRLEMSLLDASTGKARWQARLPGNAEQPGKLVVTPEVIVDVRDALTLVNAESGAVLWSVPLPAPGTADNGVFVNDRHIGLSGFSDLQVFDRQTGQRLWTHSIPEGQRLFAAYARSAGPVLVYGAADRPDANQLVGLDWSGTEIWHRTTEGGMLAPLEFRDSVLAYATAAKLVLLDSGTGGVETEQALPVEHRQSTQRRIDESTLRLMFTDNSLLVVSLGAITRVSLSKPDALDTQPLFEFETREAGPPARLPGMPQSHQQAAESQNQVAEAIRYAASTVPEAATADMVARLLSLWNPPEFDTSPVEGRSIPIAIARTGMASTFSRNQAARDFGTSMVSAFETFFRELDLSIELERHVERMISQRRGSDSLASGFLVTLPSGSCDIRLANLETGSMAKVQWRPPGCKTFQCSPFSGVRHPSASLSPDGRLLLFDGLGLDQSAYGPPLKRGERYPNYSLLVYRLDDLPFSEENATDDCEARIRLTPEQQRIADARTAKDVLYKVKSEAWEAGSERILADQKAESNRRFAAALEDVRSGELTPRVTRELTRLKNRPRIGTGSVEYKLLDTEAADALLPEGLALAMAKNNPDLCALLNVYPPAEYGWDWVWVRHQFGLAAHIPDRDSAGPFRFEPVDEQGQLNGGLSHAALVLLLEHSGKQRCAAAYAKETGEDYVDRHREGFGALQLEPVSASGQ